jgi:hypothetical protein
MGRLPLLRLAARLAILGPSRPEREPMGDGLRPSFRRRRTGLFDVLATALALALIAIVTAATINIHAAKPGMAFASKTWARP